MKKALLVIDIQNDYFPGGKFPLWNADGVLGKYAVTVLPDCCTTVSEILHQIALHALSTRVQLVPSGEAL